MGSSCLPRQCYMGSPVPACKVSLTAEHPPREGKHQEHQAGTKLHICEAGEADDFSSEEEEADNRGDHDTFTELPLYEAFFKGLQRRNVSQRKQAKHELTKYQHTCHLEDCSNHSEKALKDHDKEEKHMELETLEIYPVALSRELIDKDTNSPNHPMMIISEKMSLAPPSTTPARDNQYVLYLV
ncbi:hypothetical protein EK904_004633, partial [Melospiza melodia maxima]